MSKTNENTYRRVDTLTQDDIDAELSRRHQFSRLTKLDLAAADARRNAANDEEAIVIFKRYRLPHEMRDTFLSVVAKLEASGIAGTEGLCAIADALYGKESPQRS